MKATFCKQERLASQKAIQELFANGNSFTVFPFRVLWKEVPLKTDYPTQLAIAIPKKKFRKATDRNHLKRLVREAYRKNKSIHYEPLQSSQKQLALLLIYLPREAWKYGDIEQKIILTLQRLVKEI